MFSLLLGVIMCSVVQQQEPEEGPAVADGARPGAEGAPCGAAFGSRQMLRERSESPARLPLPQHPHVPHPCTPRSPSASAGARLGQMLHGLAPEQLPGSWRVEAAPWYSRYFHFYFHFKLLIFSQGRAVLIASCTAACKASNLCFVVQVWSRASYGESCGGWL